MGGSVIECNFCKKIFTTMKGFKNHNTETCVCLADHEHQLMCEQFKSMAEVSAYIESEELDSIFVVSSGRTNNEKIKNIVIKYLVCKTTAKSPAHEKCPANIKITRREKKYFLLGCLAHSHTIETEDLRMSGQTRELIRGLLLKGLSARTIKDCCLVNNDTCSRPVSMSDIKNIRRSVPELESDPTDAPADDGYPVDPTEPEVCITAATSKPQTVDYQKKRILAWRSKLDFALNHLKESEEWFNKNKKSLSLCFQSFYPEVVPNIPKRKAAKTIPSNTPKSPKKKKLKKTSNKDNFDLMNFLTQALDSESDHPIWQKITSHDDDDTIACIAKFDADKRTNLVEKFVEARQLLECNHCSKYALESMMSGFVFCEGCSKQCHQICLSQCTNETTEASSM